MAATRRRDPWIRWFDVTSPKKHSSGYTIYKVTSKVFPVHSPEATTEIVVWKRYKDIHKLHKTLSLVHRNLHRPAAFPDFPKPRIFGRFDDDIIEERRLAALELLNFIGSQPHLFNSLAVQEFFEASESREGEKPSHDQNILQPVSVAPAAGAEPLTSDSTGGEQEEQNTQEGEETTLQSQEGAQPTGDNPQDAAEFNPSSSVNGGDILTADGSLNTAHDTEESLSGIWAHRQTENSDGEQSECEQSDGEQSDGEQSDGEPIGSPSTAAQQLSQIAESDLRSDSDIMNEFDPYRGEGSPRQVSSPVV